MKYFIDYDNNGTTCALEEVAGDIEEYIRNEVRKMYRNGYYSPDKTHRVSYLAKTPKMTRNTLTGADWIGCKTVLVDVEGLSQDQ